MEGDDKMVWLLNQNYSTNYCVFSIDSTSDLKLLPRYNVAGKGILNTISTCCPSSKAMCTNGDIYVLNGNKNEWVKYTSSGGSSGGGELPSDVEYATDEDIENLFK